MEQKIDVHKFGKFLYGKSQLKMGQKPFAVAEHPKLSLISLHEKTIQANWSLMMTEIDKRKNLRFQDFLESKCHSMA